MLWKHNWALSIGHIMSLIRFFKTKQKMKPFLPQWSSKNPDISKLLFPWFLYWNSFSKKIFFLPLNRPLCRAWNSISWLQINQNYFSLLFSKLFLGTKIIFAFFNLINKKKKPFFYHCGQCFVWLGTVHLRVQINQN